MNQIHEAARAGFTSEAHTYAQGRPDYPDTLLPWLADSLGASTGRLVVDLGAGTGKLTTLLARTAASVVAVEPVQAMRAQLAGLLPAVPVYEGSAEHIPLETASTDAIVCAQSFHWFATPAALAEMHRVLKPGGRLGLVWNVRDESVDWVAAITRIITPHEGDAPRFYKGDWRRAFAGSLFSELQEAAFGYEHAGPASEVILKRFLSVSFIAALPAAEKAEVERQLQALLATHPALKGRETVVFPYRTQVYWAEALASQR